MTLQSRQRILTELRDAVGHPVLALVYGDRLNLHTNLAQDVLAYLPRHLEEIGRSDELGLVLYTRGGDTNSAWPIVNFIREYCQTLRIFVPFWAHSAGTLLALGANRIYMSRFATLSPIDPTVANPFNPQDPINPANRLPIAVEDVISYFRLAENHGARGEQEEARSFIRLAEAVHPLALGNVQRSIDQIKQLATKMIRLHEADLPETEVAELVHRLTTALYSHMHFINRREAQEIGLPVDEPDDEVEEIIIRYHSDLKEDLHILRPFDPASELAAAGAQPPHAVTLARAFIETPSTCDAFLTEGTISLQAQQHPQLPPGFPTPQPGTLPAVATFEITFEGWREIP